MSENTTTAKPRVLVADDEQVIANTLAIILNQAGFEARAVYSGEKAIEALDIFHPDMLISDVIMTGMTGIEAAIQTREKLPKCKILLFSGQAATADLLERARAQGHEFAGFDDDHVLVHGLESGVGYARSAVEDRSTNEHHVEPF